MKNLAPIYKYAKLIIINCTTLSLELAQFSLMQILQAKASSIQWIILRDFSLSVDDFFKELFLWLENNKTSKKWEITLNPDEMKMIR